MLMDCEPIMWGGKINSDEMKFKLEWFNWNYDYLTCTNRLGERKYSYVLNRFTYIKYRTPALSQHTIIYQV